VPDLAPPLIEELPLVTADTQLAAYGATVIDATK
jgi:hypothetical protein